MTQTPDIVRKSFPLTIGEEGRFTAVVSTAQKDLDGDVLTERCLREIASTSSDLPLLKGHDAHAVMEFAPSSKSRQANSTHTDEYSTQKRGQELTTRRGYRLDSYPWR